MCTSQSSGELVLHRWRLDAMCGAARARVKLFARISRRWRIYACAAAAATTAAATASVIVDVVALRVGCHQPLLTGFNFGLTMDNF